VARETGVPPFPNVAFGRLSLLALRLRAVFSESPALGRGGAQPSAAIHQSAAMRAGRLFVLQPSTNLQQLRLQELFAVFGLDRFPHNQVDEPRSSSSAMKVVLCGAGRLCR
jgi:hypothetical protein